MKRTELLVYGIIASTISAVMLVAALGDREYGYYDLLRVAICFTGAVTAFIAFQFKSYIVSTISALIAMVFNPFFKITLERGTWQTIDLISGLYFLIVALVFYLEYREMKKIEGSSE